jgi:[acyl-carrier-protein] S-malonyltransferase
MSSSTLIAILFPGQGSQAIGMGFELAQKYASARAIFQEADDILGYSLSQLAWEGPMETLSETLHTQPALYVHSMAVWSVFQSEFPDIKPAYTAGHSMGELSALTASGALPFAEGLKLVRRRAEVMKRAGEISPGGMAAVLGSDIETLEQICVQASRVDEIVQVANDNCPGQVVISGAKPALERAMQLASEAGIRRIKPLAVSIAAHSPLMASAQSDFNQAVSAAPITNPSIPLIGNVTALPLVSTISLSADLRAQLTSRVRWTESMRFLTQQGVKIFLELGNGSVLTGLLKRIDDQVTGIAIGAPQDLDKLRNTP